MPSMTRNRDADVTPGQAFALLGQLVNPGKNRKYGDFIPNYAGPGDSSGQEAKTASTLAAEQLTAMGVTRGVASDALDYLTRSRPTTAAGIAAKRQLGLDILFGRRQVEEQPAQPQVLRQEKENVVQISREDLDALIAEAAQQAAEKAVAAAMAAYQTKPAKAAKAAKAPKMAAPTVAPVEEALLTEQLPATDTASDVGEEVA